MSTYLTPNLLMALIISASAVGKPLQRNKDILGAVQGMQHAYHYTFAVLINMVQDEIPCNTTFLTPSDRMLAKESISENKVMEFLSRHLIPSPLLFNTHLPLQEPSFLHISKILKSEYKTKAEKVFYLDDDRLISTNICTAGTSFCCHEINGVMKKAMPKRATCSNANPTAAAKPPSAPPRSPPPPPPPPLLGPSSMDPTINPVPVQFDNRPRMSSSLARTVYRQTIIFNTETLIWTRTLAWRL